MGILRLYVCWRCHHFERVVCVYRGCHFEERLLDVTGGNAKVERWRLDNEEGKFYEWESTELVRGLILFCLLTRFQTLSSWSPTRNETAERL